MASHLLYVLRRTVLFCSVFLCFFSVPDTHCNYALQHSVFLQRKNTPKYTLLPFIPRKRFLSSKTFRVFSPTSCMLPSFLSSPTNVTRWNEPHKTVMCTSFNETVTFFFFFTIIINYPRLNIGLPFVSVWSVSNPISHIDYHIDFDISKLAYNYFESQPCWGLGFDLEFTTRSWVGG